MDRLSENTVSYATDGAVTTITLNRPHAANALDHATKEALLAAFERAHTDASRSVLWEAAGKAFCVGQDLGEHAAALNAGVDGAVDDVDASTRAAFQTVHDHYIPITTALRQLPKPVVVAINGACVGAGLGFALSADIRVAARCATFGTAFASIGLASDSGLAATLTQAVGTSRASELFLLGSTLRAEQALEWGLVHRVVDDDALPGQARELAEQFASGPTAAYAEIKALVNGAAARAFTQTLRDEAEAQHRLGSTQDHREAVHAFVHKQRPLFKGR